jgi:hypothetical protein
MSEIWRHDGRNYWESPTIRVWASYDNLDAMAVQIDWPNGRVVQIPLEVLEKLVRNLKDRRK